ncbi:3-oxoacyl-(acyl-carrier protein) reductase [Streptomyces murinus]|uniref:SDR family NAD(P)-dependent oxidoreductase n=1 Tax=Streptomyces murinus TaxID=33900 RepID=UPI003D67945C
MTDGGSDTGRSRGGERDGAGAIEQRGGLKSSPGPLADRVVAVTGAAGGLGLKTVRALLDREALVIANHRSSPGELETLRDKYPDRVWLVPGDIGEERTAEEIARTARALGRLDALVNNAGIARDQPLATMSVTDWDEVQRVNLRGAFLATKHAIRVMMRHRYGRLVYVSSLAAVAGNPGQAAYAASKAGLHGLSLTVAQEYAKYGIRSVVLAPGLLDTGLGSELPAATHQAKADRALLGVGDADSMAATIAFLTGPDADYINATVIRSDGGLAY